MSTIQTNRTIEEVILISSSIIMASIITPFAICCYFNGQFLAALIEIISVLTMCGIGTYVWKTRHTRITSLFTSVFMLTGFVALFYILGSSVLFWIYPIIITIYFITPLKVSALLVTPTMIALLPLLLQEKTAGEVISVIVTMIICQLFAYLLIRTISRQNVVMQELVNQDELTGALNRRAFDERMHFLHNFSIRHKNKQESVSSLIIFDIDNFKKINDDYGHQEGDQILINLTKVFKSSIRDTDQFYRYDREEFIIIVNGAGINKATELAEKLRKILESSIISSCTKVTASFGVAEMQTFESPIRWVDRADNAMCRAKRAGKNQVSIANHNISRPTKTKLRSA